MDDDHPQPARPLRLWPWLVIVTAVAGCAAIDGLQVDRPRNAWGVLQPWGLLLLCFSLLIYATCLFRSAEVYHRLFWVPGRSPLLTVAVVTGFAVPLGLIALLAFASVDLQCAPTLHQDHWPFLVVVIGLTGLMDLAGQSRVLATPRPRFTLRGLLIATFLVALIAGTVRFLVQRHREAMQARANLPLLLELSALDTALKTCHERYGVWPPEGPEQFDASVQKAFPKARHWRADLAAAGLDPETMGAEEALVFWLGGMPDPKGPRRLAGFSEDGKRPFGPGGPRTLPLFEFDPNRLTDADRDGWPEYRAPDRYGSTRPKVYRLEGKTIVAVEYSGGGAPRVPQRIYRLIDGRVEASAPPLDTPPLPRP
jgi:hypothetical protein